MSRRFLKRPRYFSLLSAIAVLFIATPAIGCQEPDEMCEIVPIEPIDRVQVYGKAIIFPDLQDPFYGWDYTNWDDLYDHNMDPRPEPAPQPEHECTAETYVSAPFTVSQTHAYNNNVTFRQITSTAIGAFIGGTVGGSAGAAIGTIVAGYVATRIPSASCGWRIQTNVTICDATDNFFDGQHVQIPVTVRSTSSSLVNYGDPCVDDTIEPPCPGCDLN